MKISLFLFLTVLTCVHTETITKSDPCTCKQILSSNDCTQRTDCQWNLASAACEMKTSTDHESYCSQNIKTCPTAGCALYKQTCQAFSGCTVYPGITHSDCQTISSLCTSDGEKCIDVIVGCIDYKVQISCQINQQNYPCYWDTTSKVCQEVSACSQLTFNTHDLCFQYGGEKSLKCTTKDGGGCIDMVDVCANYTQQISCVINTASGVCFWDGTKCKEKTCNNAPTTYTTQAQCTGYLSTCSVNGTTAGCIDSPLKCEDYTIEAQCVKLKSDICNWQVITCTKDQTDCKASASCMTWTCINAPNSMKTDSACQQYKNECTVNSTGIGCIVRQITCSGYTSQGQCVKTLDEKTSCYWNGTACVNKSCDSAVLTLYNDYQCSKFMSQCTVVNAKCGLRTCGTYADEDSCSLDYQNQQCVWSGSCTVRTCANATIDITSHADCFAWLNTCTIQTDLTGCITQSAKCESYLKEEQCYLATGGVQCLWINKVCKQKTCLTASTLISSDDECNTYLNGCMVNATAQGCVARAATCNLLTQSQCSFTLSGGLCQWVSNACVARSCTQAMYNTFKACSTFMPTCTVKFDGTNYNGCIDMEQNCSTIQYQQTCLQSIKDGLCIWNTKASPNACEARSCANSDQTSSDDACSNHLSTCTVNSAKTGCMERYALCTSYTSQVNCFKNKTGGECLWYNSACTDKTCDLADKTFTTHDQCQSYSTKCTTNGKGCVAIGACSDATVKPACVSDKDNALCAYQPSCNLQACSDAPQSYSTDKDCIKFKPECTTNGNGCVLRANCSDVYIEEACVTNSSGNACTWINNRCIDFGCSSAPSKYVTEKECQLYKNGCTVNQSGGCVIKGLCTDAKIQAACTTDKYGKECYFSTSGCRNMVCTDYDYTTHAECIAALSTCTSDGTNCINQSTCSKKIQGGCFYGSDGPCLWVNNACWPYTSCTSLQFATHDECYNFNNQCTTNGVNCIPIDKCANLPQSSCFQGTDGRCVFTPDTLGGTAKCTLFKACNTGVFSTHSECQIIDAGCTTDSKGCIELLACSEYTLPTNCMINTKKAQCFYDTKTNKCSDLTCGNIVFPTHLECNTQLSTCTTDNTKCIPMDKCSTYDKVYCNTSLGSDGKCQYDPNTLKCRLALCTELVENCTNITNCVDSGIGCVVHSTCDKYTTEKGCQQGGTDGLCVWQLNSGEGTCKQMSTCADASTNKAACQQKSWNCQWTETSTTSTCASHTCSSYSKSSGACQPILDFTKINYSLCALTSQQCISTEFASLTAATCFQATKGTYTWDSAHSKCLKCGTTYTNTTTNNQTNTTNTTNTTDTGSREDRLFIAVALIISIYI